MERESRLSQLLKIPATVHEKTRHRKRKDPTWPRRQASLGGGGPPFIRCQPGSAHRSLFSVLMPAGASVDPSPLIATEPSKHGFRTVPLVWSSVRVARHPTRAPGRRNRDEPTRLQWAAATSRAHSDLLLRPRTAEMGQSDRRAELTHPISGL